MWLHIAMGDGAVVFSHPDIFDITLDIMNFIFHYFPDIISKGWLVSMKWK